MLRRCLEIDLDDNADCFPLFFPIRTGDGITAEGTWALVHVSPLGEMMHY